MWSMCANRGTDARTTGLMVVGGRGESKCSTLHAEKYMGDLEVCNSLWSFLLVEFDLKAPGPGTSDVGVNLSETPFALV